MCGAGWAKARSSHHAHAVALKKDVGTLRFARPTHAASNSSKPLPHENEIVPFGRGAVGKHHEDVHPIRADISVLGFVVDVEARRFLVVARRQWTGGVVVG